MTVREELQKLGPDRVRMAMASFTERTGLPYGHRKPDGTLTGCFITHAFADAGGYDYVRRAAGHQFFGLVPTSLDGMAYPAVEAAFEGFVFAEMSREELRLECIAFLAENGSASGPPMHGDQFEDDPGPDESGLEEEGIDGDLEEELDDEAEALIRLGEALKERTA